MQLFLLGQSLQSCFIWSGTEGSDLLWRELPRNHIRMIFGIKHWGLSFEWGLQLLFELPIFCLELVEFFIKGGDTCSTAPALAYTASTLFDWLWPGLVIVCFPLLIFIVIRWSWYTICIVLTEKSDEFCFCDAVRNQFVSNFGESCSFIKVG